MCRNDAKKPKRVVASATNSDAAAATRRSINVPTAAVPDADGSSSAAAAEADQRPPLGVPPPHSGPTVKIPIASRIFPSVNSTGLPPQLPPVLGGSEFPGPAAVAAPSGGAVPKDISLVSSIAVPTPTKASGEKPLTALQSPAELVEGLGNAIRDVSALRRQDQGKTSAFASPYAAPPALSGDYAATAVTAAGTGGVPTPGRLVLPMYDDAAAAAHLSETGLPPGNGDNDLDDNGSETRSVVLGDSDGDNEDGNDAPQTSVPGDTSDGQLPPSRAQTDDVPPPTAIAVPVGPQDGQADDVTSDVDDESDEDATDRAAPLAPMGKSFSATMAAASVKRSSYRPNLHEKMIKMSGSMVQRMSGVVMASQVVVPLQANTVPTSAEKLTVATGGDQTALPQLPTTLGVPIGPPARLAGTSYSNALSGIRANRDAFDHSAQRSDTSGGTGSQAVMNTLGSSNNNSAHGWGEEEEELFNERGIVVIQRVHDKLTGLDFVGDGNGPAVPLRIPEQIDRLILQATSNENLCTSFFGWCPFW
jgi:hypothetical protein